MAQFGLPPNRIDILTGLTGLDFERAWVGRIPAQLEGVQVSVRGLEAVASPEAARAKALKARDVELGGRLLRFTRMHYGAHWLHDVLDANGLGKWRRSNQAQAHASSTY